MPWCSFLPDVSRTVAFLLVAAGFFLTLQWIPEYAKQSVQSEQLQQRRESDETVRQVIEKVRADDPEAWRIFCEWEDADDRGQFDSFAEWKAHYRICLDAKLYSNRSTHP